MSVDFTGHERIIHDQTLADAAAAEANAIAAGALAAPYRRAADERFLAELDAVCQRYGRSLWHEDEHGAFLVVPYDPLYASVLLAAYRPND